MDLRQALSQLDPENDEHWTQDGAPLIFVLEDLMGVKGLKRQAVVDTAPKLTRESARKALTVTEPVPEAEAAPSEEPVPEAEAAPSEEPGPGVEPMSELDAAFAERKELTERMLAAQSDADETKKLANRLADEVNTLNRHIEMLERRDPNHATRGVRDYINRSNEERQKRAARTAEFLGGSGITAADAAKALDPRAPIDKAMAARKAAPGTTRPVHGRAG